MKTKTRQAKIYVGLNDATKHEQLYEKERYISVLKNVCRSYHTAFSFDVINGGYFHEDGTYVEENSLELTLLDVSDELVNEIAKDLCAFFHQESVMVVYSQPEVEFIQEIIG
ncbi:MAG: hypothetical protein IJK53_04045 [Erysipelotrichaceae bacterium]|nr:hypothetical protein [Erysipelotrichaceae bacterium]